MRGARAERSTGHDETQTAARAAARLRGSGFRDWYRSVVPNDRAASPADPTEPSTAVAPVSILDRAEDSSPLPEREAADRLAQPDHDLTQIDLADDPARPSLPDRSEPANHPLFPLPNSPQPEPPSAAEQNGPDFSRLEKQIRFLTTQLEIMRSPCRADTLIAELRQQLANIAQAIENVVPRSAFQALEDEVRALGARLDVNRSAATDGVVFAALEQGLADIRTAVRGVTPAELDHVVQTLSRKIDQINDVGPDPLIFRQLDTAIDALRDIVNQIASGDALAALVKEVRALGEKVEQAVTAGPRSTASSSSDELLLGLEKQISGMVDALARSVHTDRTAASPIEPLIETINQKLDRFDLLDGKLALEPIKQHINELGEKIDRLHAPQDESTGLAQLERRLSDLANAIERLNLSDRPLPALEPIEERISALAEKLDRIEYNSRPGAERASVPETRLGAPSMIARGTAELKTSAAGSVLQTATAPEANALAAETTLAHDAPLEPGSGPPRFRNTAAALGRPGASRVAPGAVAPDPTDKPPAWPNFIVAARRAAKAASEPPPPISVADTTDHAAAGAVTRTLAERVKSLFLSTSLILVGLGAAGIVLSSADLLGVGRQKTADRLVAAAQVASTKVASAEGPSTQAPGTQVASAEPPNIQAPSILAPKPTSDAAGTTPATTETPIPLPRPARIGEPPAKLAATAESAEPAPPQREAARPAERPDLRNTDVTASIAPQRNTARAAAVHTPSKPTADPGPAWSDPLPTTIATQSILAGIAERNPATAYEVAMRYIEGRVVTTDVATATIWLTRAADGGIVPAQFRLGSMYEKGVGVERNLMEARRLYHAPAAKGHATALPNPPGLFAEGVGDRQDHAAAAEWFRKAAEYGVTDSQFNLAVLYARGLGVERNYGEAFKWFSIAAAKGDRDAALKRDELAARLDPQTLTAAQNAASAFVPKQQPAEATSASPPAGGWEDGALGKSKSHDRPRGQQARL